MIGLSHPFKFWGDAPPTLHASQVGGFQIRASSGLRAKDSMQWLDVAAPSIAHDYREPLRLTAADLDALSESGADLEIPAPPAIDAEAIELGEHDPRIRRLQEILARSNALIGKDPFDGFARRPTWAAEVDLYIPAPPAKPTPPTTRLVRDGSGMPWPAVSAASLANLARAWANKPLPPSPDPVGAAFAMGALIVLVAGVGFWLCGQGWFR